MEQNPLNKFMDEAEKAEKKALLYQQFYEELRNDPRIIAHYKDFDPVSVDEMLQEHAREKVYLLENGPHFVETCEQKDLKYSDMAMACLKEIQQKKLFNLQCQWRAELVTDPRIESTEDFVEMGEDILNCKLISQIESDEIDLYYQYMQSDDYTYVPTFIPNQMWQFYEGMKMSETNPEKFLSKLFIYPPWYRYHDTYATASNLMLLPDIRGEKEHYYLDIAFAHQKENAVEDTNTTQQATALFAQNNQRDTVEEQDAQPEVEDEYEEEEEYDDEEDDDEYEEDEDGDEALEAIDPSRVYERLFPNKLSVLNLTLLSQFVSQYEDIDVQLEYKKAGGENRWNDTKLYKEAYDITSKLSEIGEILPIEPHRNWIEALNNTFYNYEFQKMKENINPIYEQYLLYQASGISFAPPPHNEKEWYKKPSILLGRKLAGEPEDFDF